MQDHGLMVTAMCRTYFVQTISTFNNNSIIFLKHLETSAMSVGKLSDPKEHLVTTRTEITSDGNFNLTEHYRNPRHWKIVIGCLAL